MAMRSNMVYMECENELLLNFTNEWHGDAECRDNPDSDLRQMAEIFFGPDRRESKEKTIQRLEIAQKLCSVCPVAKECFDQMVDIEAELEPNSGIWGGHLVFYDRNNIGGKYVVEKRILPLDEAIKHYENKSRRDKKTENAA